MAIALLGHGQADDPGLRVAHDLEDRAGIVLCDEHVEDAADDTGPFQVPVALQGGVEAILRRQPVMLVGPDETDADDAPVQGTAGFGQDVLR